jgi:hypothetical protein
MEQVEVDSITLLCAGLSYCTRLALISAVARGQDMCRKLFLGRC